MHKIDLYYWHGGPRRPTKWEARLEHRLGIRFSRRWVDVPNFGDLLSPLLVNAILHTRNLSLDSPALEGRQLLAIGSVLHAAGNEAVIWGSGRNARIGDDQHQFSSLDVRAVRGPRTANFLQSRGITVPEIYGDPALLISHFFPIETWQSGVAESKPFVVVPHFKDLDDFPLPHPSWLVSPLLPVADVLRYVANSQLVISSSLHGIIVAEALGIPARWLKPTGEPLFKFHDYYEGTGRPTVGFASSIEEALEMGGCAAPRFSTESLLEAFPWDLWSGSRAVS